MNTDSGPSTKDKIPTLRRIGRSIKRGAKPAGKVLLAIAIVTLIIHSFLLMVWGRQLEHKLNHLRSQGQAVDVADIIPKPVTDSQNAAVLYQQAFKLMGPPRNGTKVHQWDPGKNDIPNEFFNGPATGERAKLMPEVRMTISRNAPAFTLVEQAVKRPKCVFPIKWDDGVYATLPHLGLLRHMERLITARAVVRATDGDVDGAVHDTILGLDAADSQKDEWYLIALLVRQAMIKQVMTGLMESTRTHPLSYGQSKLLYDRLNTIDFNTQMARSMQGERVLMKWIYDTLRANPLEMSMFSDQPKRPDEPGLPLKTAAVIGGYLWRPLSYKDQMISFDMLDKYSPLFKQSYRKLRSQPIPNPAKEAPKYAVVTRMWAVPFERLAKAQDDSYAQVRLGQTAMALQAYKSRFGNYPKSLDELNRKLGWKLPDDPFSGKPFVYKTTGEGFRLYSVGQNLKDDGGQTDAKTLQNDVSANKGDIVWINER